MEKKWEIDETKYNKASVRKIDECPFKPTIKIKNKEYNNAAILF